MDKVTIVRPESFCQVGGADQEPHLARHGDGGGVGQEQYGGMYMGVVSQEVELEATVTSLELSLAASYNPAPELTQAVKLSIHPPPFPA